AGEVAADGLELGLEQVAQRQAIGGRAGEASENATTREHADLAGAGLDDRVAHRDLTIGSERDLAVPTHTQDRGRADRRAGDRLLLLRHRAQYMPGPSPAPDAWPAPVDPPDDAAVYAQRCDDPR